MQYACVSSITANDGAAHRIMTCGGRMPRSAATGLSQRKDYSCQCRRARNTPSAARPPASTRARTTRIRLTTQAIPSPSAAHCTHQTPGEVIRLMTNRKARISGAVNRNFTERNVLCTVPPNTGIIDGRSSGIVVQAHSVPPIETTMPRLPSRPVIYEINTIAWLSGLSRRAGATVTPATVPQQEGDTIAALGVHAVWLMGVWERSPAGLAVALATLQLLSDFRSALPDVTLDDIAASAYCVRRYVPEGRFGGSAGLALARERLASRGVRLILDFVPNHLARDHPWVEAHPERFIQGTPADLAANPVGFFHAGAHVIACGRDPYFPPWSDVAQVNAFSPGLRMGSVDALSEIASQCDGVRCDMAMLLMSDVFATTWGARAGAAPEEDFWPTVIRGVRAHAPDFTFIAEA